jgi:hypothetical protein
LIIRVTKSSESKKKCISRGITLHTVVGHFQLWELFFYSNVDNLHFFLERGSAMTRATFVIYRIKCATLNPQVIIKTLTVKNSIDLLFYFLFFFIFLKRVI